MIFILTFLSRRMNAGMKGGGLLRLVFAPAAAKLPRQLPLPQHGLGCAAPCMADSGLGMLVWAAFYPQMDTHIAALQACLHLLLGSVAAPHLCVSIHPNVHWGNARCSMR